MLVPDIKIKDTNDNNEKNTIDVNGILRGDYFDVEIFFSDKARDKFIKSIEKLIRTSYEYRNYIGILKNELNLTKCTFLPGIDINELGNGNIEFHHYPFTLYDLVDIEVDKAMMTGSKKIDPFNIADSVMINHYKNIVGLVPLSLTVHELVHDGKKFINKKYIIGNWESYIKKYDHLINGDYREKLNQLLEMSRLEDLGRSFSDEELLKIKLLNIDYGIDDEERFREIEIKGN